MKKLPLLSFFVLLFGLMFLSLGCKDEINHSWKIVGNPDLSDGEGDGPSLSVWNGTPYLAYADNAHNARATVMTFDGKNWVALGSPGFSAGKIYSVSICIANGTPYVAFLYNAFIKVYDSFNITSDDDQTHYFLKVMRFNGKNWEPVGNYPSLHEITSTPLLYVGENNRSYLAYCAGSENVKTWVKMYDGKDWKTVGLINSVLNLESLNVLNGIPYLAIKTDPNKQNTFDGATVLKLDGNNWVTVGNSDFPVGGTDIPLSLTFENEIPHVSSFGFDNSTRWEIKEMKLDGKTWIPGRSYDYLKEMAFCESLFVYKGTPFVAGKKELDSSKLTVMKYE